MFKSRTISAGNLDTAPFSAVSMQGKLSYNGHTLSLSGYKRSQVSRLRRGDYLLANGELIKLRDIVKQMTSQVIILAYYPSYTPSTNFTNEDFKWSRGSGWGDYPKEWHLFGDDFEVDGRAYTEGVNYTDLTDQVVLVQANDDVRVAVGNIAKEGNGVGGDGIEDVPAGKNLSGRINGEWVEIPVAPSGTITENVHVEIEGDHSYQVGNDGDSINLNLDIPAEFKPFANTFSGFDYQSDKFQAVVGLVKGVNFPDLALDNADIVGRFMMEGNPFNSTPGSEGSVFMDGVWHEEDDGEEAVAANRASISFKEGQIEGLNLFRQYKTEQELIMQGNNGVEQNIFTFGEEASQAILLEGNKSSQDIAYIGDEGIQSISLVGNYGSQENTISGNNNFQLYNILGNNNKRSFYIEGDSNIQETLIVGSDNLMSRKLINDTNNKSFIENIEDSNHITTLTGDYDYTADSFFFRGTGAIRQISGTTQAVTAGAGFTVRQGANVTKHHLYTNGNFQLGRNAAYSAISYVESGNKIGFFNADPVAQQIVPIGSTNDDIIIALQNLGLFSED